jgi:hypothetical protein
VCGGGKGPSYPSCPLLLLLLLLLLPAALKLTP